MAMRRLLAITHETTLTGAPMNLLHFLTWVRENTDVELHVLALSDGPLRHRFERVARVTVLDRNPLATAMAVLQQGLVQLGSSTAWKPVARARLAPQLRRFEGFDLVYSNSLASTAILPALPAATATVSHVHELQVALRTWRPADHVKTLVEVPDAWIAASGAVAEMLTEELGLPADRVLLHHEFIDAEAVAARRVPLREVERHRRELGIPADAAVVLGAGTIDWRKGADNFVQLATEVRRRTREPVRFVWVGGDLVGTDWERIRSDIDRTGSDHVHFVGVKPDPVPWFAMADVFALTSREDPYPLVGLEHAALGVPIVTYRNGGMPELLEAAGPEAAVGIADHLDVGGLADRVLALLNSDRLHRVAGSQLRRAVLDDHDVSVAAPRLHADLDRLVRSRAARPSGSPAATRIGGSQVGGVSSNP